CFVFPLTRFRFADYGQKKGLVHYCTLIIVAMTRLLHIVGARPNFMKAAPVIAAFRSHHGVSQSLVHTGQHYDVNMSSVFFTQLALPPPDVNLEIGSDTHAKQTAAALMKLEPVVTETSPDVVMLYGDVNSTLAAALLCAKLSIPVAHVEAGLR